MFKLKLKTFYDLYTCIITGPNLMRL